LCVTITIYYDRILTFRHYCYGIALGDLQVVGLSPGRAPLCSGLGQATYRPRGVICLSGKLTAGLVESNGSLPPGLWLMSPAGWLPRNWD